MLIGAEGGLGHLAIQYAKVMELRTIVADGGAEKEKLCSSLEAGHFIDYTSAQAIPTGVLRIKTYGAHGVVQRLRKAMRISHIHYILDARWSRLVCRLVRLAAGATPKVLAVRSSNIVGAVTDTLKQVNEA